MGNTNKRAKKVQKRNAKKSAAKKQVNQIVEMDRLSLKEIKRHQSMLTKDVIIDILINDMDCDPDDCKLYFDTLEDELKIDFDSAQTKPAALEMEFNEEVVKSKATPWYQVFVGKILEKYSEDDEGVAAKRASDIASGVMTCMASASEIIKWQATR